ncbi:DUF262 domain-containing protein [Methylocystis sp. SC2]|uniref:DUF262 domain-containing protein n=1 Tax=Methylocystis sp. (strain SC2) TaxID=187303 RepID=UPI00027AF065|nr:DUF262 domain-containing protein [Methylocystis sp. SC2]CCJ08271.1 Conserved hypothetical protein [Methylocystis sp. SC2]
MAVDKNSLLTSFNNAQAQLVVQTADLPLGTLADMVENKAIDLEPGFQRRERWSVDKQSALIESFLLNVPVPPIYLAEEKDGTYTAIDGKQRLKAIADYIMSRYALKGLERLTIAEGTRFSNLPTEIINSLKLRPFLRVVTLLKQTDALLKYEVFLRLNRGGESLNNQEIRNVAFRGRLNTRIYELSSHHFLCDRLKIDGVKSAAFREMDDAEYVLRFLTLREQVNGGFGGSLGKEMDSFMQTHQYASKAQVEKFASQFSIAIERCEALWGDKAFRRPEGNDWRDQTLAGMYDAQMLAASCVTTNVYRNAVKKTKQLLAGTKRLFSDTEFDKAVRTGTNTPARIAYRFNKMKELLVHLG